MNIIQKTGIIGTAMLCAAGFSACTGSTKNSIAEIKNINYDNASKIKGMQDKAYTEASMNINKINEIKSKIDSDTADTVKPEFSATVKSPEIAIKKQKFSIWLSDFILSDCEDYLEENKR